MAENKKSILDEALLDVKRIQEALQANTKEILHSIAKEEINGLVKESLNEEDFQEEDVDTDLEATTDDSETDDTEEVSTTELEPVATDDIVNTDETPITNDQEIGGNEMDALTSELGTELDMTSADDEDVIAVYKKLSGNDEIEVVGSDIHINVSEPGEYIVKDVITNTEPVAEPITEPLATNDTELGMPSDDEAEYEISLDNSETDNIESDLEPVATDDETTEETPDVEATEDSEEKEELDETLGATRGTAGKQGANHTGAAHNPKPLDESKKNDSKLLKETTEKYNKLLNEAKNIKKENNEFRVSLKKFRDMLVETVVFNANLTYATKLMTEFSTTANEKKMILKRFDEEVSNLNESKKLYKIIKNELTTKKTNMVESIDKKINNEIQTGSSKLLNESTVYVDESTERIKDLFKRVEKR